MAAAYYLARAGAYVTIYEKREKLGGIVSSVIPDFRIDDDVIGKDVSLLEKLGVKILCNTEAPSVDELKKEYDTHFARGCSKSLACQKVCPMEIPTLASMLKMNARR